MLTHRSCRRGNGLYWRPALFQSVADQFRTATQAFRPARLAVSDAVVGNHPTQPGVAGLLFSGSPSTIARHVAFAIVDTVKRMRIAGSRPHVSIERPKIIPFQRNRYTPTAIIGIIGIVGVAATLLALRPGSIGAVAFNAPLTAGDNMFAVNIHNTGV